MIYINKNYMLWYRKRDWINLSKSKENGVTPPEKLGNCLKRHFRLHKSFDLSSMEKREKAQIYKNCFHPFQFTLLVRKGFSSYGYRDGWTHDTQHGTMRPMGVTRLFTDLHRNRVTNTHSQEEEDSVTQSTWALTQEHSEQLGSWKPGFIVFWGWGTPLFPARQCHQLVWIMSWLSGKPTTQR